jgi:lactoylglutathione lyase
MRAKLEYTGIRVKDLDVSIKFYTNVLGMTVGGQRTLEPTRGVVVDLLSEGGGPPLELNYYPQGSVFDARYEVGEGLDHLGFKVDDLDGAIAEAQRAGYPVVQEMRSATSRWVYIQDPNGIWIELYA